MSNNLSTHNDITELYKNPPILKKDGMACPVCKKLYKREKALKTHMEKMDCYKIGDIFKNTLYEEAGLEVFSGLSEKKMPLFIFRKSTMYTQILKFVLFCYTNEIKCFGTFYSFVAASTKRQNPNIILKAAISDEKFIKPYRDFLQKNPEEIGTDFFEGNKERLLEDELFLVRSIEKAHVSVIDLVESEEFREIIENLPTDYFIRVEKVYEGAV